MFSSGPNYTKLKTHLRLAINRLKLLEKKKNELAQKSRKEIADYISAGKIERAKIRVEHIIREDYLVEAMEIVEMYCDLLLARFGLIQQMKVLDEGLAESISSILWVAPRLQTDVPELKVISDLFTAKYGKEYNLACKEGAIGTISEKLKHKLSVQALPKLLIEKYLIEISKIYQIEYTPDPQVMKDEEKSIGVDSLLVDLGNDKNNLGEPGLNPQPPGFIGFPQPPMLPQNHNNSPFNYPGLPNAPPPGGLPPLPPQAPVLPFGAPFSYNIPPNDQSQENASKPLNVHLEKDIPPPPYSDFPPDLDNINQQNSKPKPMPRAKLSPGGGNFQDLPDLPNVPSDILPDAPGEESNDDIDFDDLAKRFEELKRKK